MSLRSIFCDLFKCQEYTELKATVEETFAVVTDNNVKLTDVLANVALMAVAVATLSQEVAAMDLGGLTDGVARIEAMLVPNSVTILLPAPNSQAVGDIMTVGVYLNVTDPVIEVGAFGVGHPAENKVGLSYDTTALRFAGILKGDLTADWNTLDAHEANPGEVTIGGYAGAGTPVAMKAGQLFLIDFEVLTEFAETDIQLNNYVDDLIGFIPEPVYGKLVR